MAETLHVNRPLVGLIAASGGAPGSRLKVKIWGGESGSLAVVAKAKRFPARTNLAGGMASIGGELVNWFFAFAVGTLRK